MSTANNSQFFLQRTGRFFSSIVKSIVSAIPSKKLLIEPQNKTTVQPRNTHFKEDDEIHYHRPSGKPAVEKQTLLTEKKKGKNANK